MGVWGWGLRIQEFKQIVLILLFFVVEGSCFGGLEFRVQDVGFKVQGSGFRVHGSGFRFQGSGFRVQGPGFRVQVPWFKSAEFECRACV